MGFSNTIIVSALREQYWYYRVELMGTTTGVQAMYSPADKPKVMAFPTFQRLRYQYFACVWFIFRF